MRKRESGSRLNAPESGHLIRLRGGLRKGLGRLFSLVLCPVVLLTGIPGTDALAAVPPMENVQEGETEAEAFIRMGEEFFNKYVKDKYSYTPPEHQQNDISDILTLESIYALEYAMNKDLLSDETVEALTTGDNKVVDLPTYTRTLNGLCAELLPAIVAARRSTDAPEQVPADLSQITWEDELSWEWGDKGSPAPNFSELSFIGRDLAGCSNVIEYLFYYANMDKYALWNGDKEFYNDGTMLYLGDDNTPIIGWFKRPDGKIMVQGMYSFDKQALGSFYNADNNGYVFVNSDRRYYLLKKQYQSELDAWYEELVPGSTTLNFSEDAGFHDAPWYDYVYAHPEDRDIVWTPDDQMGVADSELEEMVGTDNAFYMSAPESFGYQRLFYLPEMGLPMATDVPQYDQVYTIVNNGPDEIELGSLTTAKIKVAVEGDDGWFADHMRFLSMDESVAYVDESGTVYGISEGETDVYVTIKSSGRAEPLKVRVRVTDSPNITSKVPVGYVTEDAAYQSVLCDIYMDTLTDNMVYEGGDAVWIWEQPIFVKNHQYDGHENDPAFYSEPYDLSLERMTQTVGVSTMPMEEYKKLATALHAKGKKLFLVFQSCLGRWSSGGFVDGTDWRSAFNNYKYGTNTTQDDAIIDAIFEAEIDYFDRYGDMYKQCGVDCIVLDNIAEYMPDSFFYIKGENRWPALINKIRETTGCEIRAYYSTATGNDGACIDNADIFGNVDGVIVACGYNISDYLEDENPDIDTIKNMINEHYASFTDKLYERYGIPIETEWWIPSTKILCDGHKMIDGGIGKRAYEKPVEGGGTQIKFTEVDYLQQMKTWQAIMEVFSVKPYTTAVHTRYTFLHWKPHNHGYDNRSGLDTTASVYQKPAAQLLKLWSTGTMGSLNGGKCSISSLSGGEGNLYDGFILLKEGDTAQLNMADGGKEYICETVDPDVVSVSDTGMLTAKYIGETMLFVNARDGSLTKLAIPVCVLPGAYTQMGELYSRAVDCFDDYVAKGANPTLKNLKLMYELAVRINESKINPYNVVPMVEGGVFEWNTAREYSAFVDALARTDGLEISQLELEGSGGHDNEYYRFEYLTKDPYGPNMHMDTRSDWTGGGDGEMCLKYNDDSSRAYGWADFGWGSTVQYPVGKLGDDPVGELGKDDFYHDHMIFTGDRIFFATAADNWRLYKSPLTLHIRKDNTTTVDVALTPDEDGAVTVSDFEALLTEKGCEDYLNTLKNALATEGKGSEITVTITKTDGESADTGFTPVDLPVGYPVDTILDFECEDITEDGTTTLNPEVTVKYSPGNASYLFRLKGTKDWSPVPPKTAGTYEVMIETEPSGGYRKGVKIKTAVIMPSSGTVPDPEPVPPDAPEGVSAGLTDGAVSITWTTAADIDRYRVERSDDGGSTWQTSGYSLSGSYTSEYDCTVTRIFRIRAIRDGLVSEPSAATGSVAGATHALTHYARVEATEDAAGHIEYWECSDCHKLFSDENGTTEVTASEIVIPQKDPPGPDPEDNSGLTARLTDGTEYMYTGSKITPAVVVKNNGVVLTPGRDYAIKYSGNLNVKRNKKNVVISGGKVVITGKGNLSGSKTLYFKINPVPLDDDGIETHDVRVKANSKAVPVITFGNYTLTSKDYTVANASKKYKESGVMTVKGKGNFTGSVEVPVDVVPSNELKKFTVVADTKHAIVFDPGIYENADTEAAAAEIKAILSAHIKVYDSADKKHKTPLTEDESYVIIYPRELDGDGKLILSEAGSKKLTVIGIGGYTGSASKTLKVKPLAVKASSDNGAITTNAAAIRDGEAEPYVSTGAVIGSRLNVTYTDKAGTAHALTEGKDYKMTYSGNKQTSTAKKKATYKITFIGNYKGTPQLKNVTSKKVKISDYSFSVSGLPIAGENGVPINTDGRSIRVELPDLVYSGKAGLYKSVPYLLLNDSAFASSNYTVSYYSDPERTKAVGKKNKISIAEGETEATVYVKISAKGNTPGKGNYTGIILDSYKVLRKPDSVYDLSKAKVTIYKSGYVPGSKKNKVLKSVSYTGRPREIEKEDIGGTIVVQYKLDGKKYTTLEKGRDYTVRYLNNTDKGKAVILIEGLEEPNEYAEGKTRRFIGTARSGFSIVSKNLKSLIEALLAGL